MPRFYFQVTDTEGRVRKGSMEARSLAEAREVALKRGFTVVELREVAEMAEPAIKVETRPATTRYHAGPAPRRDFTPSWGQRLADWFPLSVIRGLMGLLMVAGLVWMAVGWKHAGYAPGAGPVKNKPTASPHPFHLLVEGAVKVEGSSTLGDVQVTLDLPDIPYQQTFDWPKLKHPREGHFVAEVEFESMRRARQLIVRANKPGMKEAATELLHVNPDGDKVTAVKLTIKPKTK